MKKTITIAVGILALLGLAACRHDEAGPNITQVDIGSRVAYVEPVTVTDNSGTLRQCFVMVGAGRGGITCKWN